MKANEAPKKIYIHVRANKELGTTWHGKKITNSDIEYIRKDAFIEKACDAYCAICDTKECEGCAECSWVIKFRRQLLKY